MAWDRDDRRGWREGPWPSRDERYGSPERGYRDEEDRYRGRGGEDRGFFERARDEVTSWFGDEEAERRRQSDERIGGRDSGREYERNRGWERGERWSSGRHDFDRGEREHRRTEGGYRPIAGDYGRGSEDRRDYGRDSNWERDPYRRTSFAGSTAGPNRDDPHYHEWRRRQMEELDRDYDEYRHECQARFESDFSTWRERRQSKRQLLGRIREHMEVVGSDEQHVGTVDRVAGDRIILTRSDPEAGGAHHSLSCTDVDRVEGDRVILDVSAEQARQRWRDEDRGRALFEREDQGEAGPHVLDRSFSGTYR